ncbi:MAG TPA: hypothetical protein VER12_04570 [Polyangiaceae bacterium]|nr:hypothetical protein [Polyangiaceae bacterium]
MATWPDPKILIICLIAFPLIEDVTGCAGRASTEGSFAMAGVGAGGASSAMAGVGAGGASSATAGVGAGGASAGRNQSDFLPDQPRAYDASNGLGSFEENAGFGWDTCSTRTPGMLSRQPGGPNDSTYLSFESGDVREISDHPSVSQVYLWSDSASEVSENLYFDAKNLKGQPLTGSVRFYGTDRVCSAEQLLVEVDLAKLQLLPEWGLRCVTVSGLLAHQALGIAISGSAYSVGLDAFRFGPPCHTTP